MPTYTIVPTSCGRENGKFVQYMPHKNESAYSCIAYQESDAVITPMIYYQKCICSGIIYNAVVQESRQYFKFQFGMKLHSQYSSDPCFLGNI